MNREQEEFLELAESKLHSAEVLLDAGEYSDSVSRSYYGMFNAAKALLLKEDSSPRTHEGVNSELGKLFREELDRQLLRDFSHIQKRREKADYTNVEIEKEEAKEILGTAREFLEKVRDLLD